MDDDRVSICMRPSPLMRLIGPVLIWTLALASVLMALFKSPGAWWYALLFGAIATWWYVYPGFLEITVADGRLTSRTLTGERSVLLDSVAHVEAVLMPFKGRRSRHWYIDLHTTQGGLMRVWLQPFRPDEVRLLLAVLDRSAGGAAITNVRDSFT